DEGGSSVRGLREEYALLSAKYADLVARGQYRWGFRLPEPGAPGQVSPGGRGVAVARDGRILFRDAIFTGLDRARWVLVSDPRGRPRSLAAWALRLIRELPAGRAVRSLRLSERGGPRLLALRLEVQQRRREVLIWAEDVTGSELQDLDLAQVRHSLIQQHRLLMLGEAAAAVAHDLGSTLRGLAFRAATLRRDAGVLRAHADTLAALEEGLSLATATVQRLHDFVRSGAPTLQSVDIAAVLRSAVALFQLELSANERPVRIDVDVPEVPPLRGPSADLSHLFLNLLRNASDAMPAGGAIHIRGRVTRTAVVLVFEDEGTGISPGLMHRVFEPFFTTKGPRGTGLGLWLAAGTMRRMGGSIVATPARKRGARFILTFPLRGAAVPAAGRPRR
ncbi:MAG: sensor histidine kinase, partial [Myxococcales bacterium]